MRTATRPALAAGPAFLHDGKQTPVVANGQKKTARKGGFQLIIDLSAMADL